MSKHPLLSLFACMLAICSLGHSNAFGKGTYYPDVTDASLMWDYKPYEVDPINGNYPNGCPFPAPASLHAFVWGQWPDWSTYNDWTTVRSDTPDSNDDYSLMTNLSIIADTLPLSPVPATNDTRLIWSSPTTIAPGFGTFAGYQWSVPETGPGSDQVIIGSHISVGQLNYPAGIHQPTVLQMRDGDGNVLWSHDSLASGFFGNDFLPNATSYWPDKTTKTIQIIMHMDPEYIVQPHWIWGGNSGYLGSISLFTVDEGPRCGDAEHQIPVGDFNGDCVVDGEDLNEISADWLECNDPANPEQCSVVPCPEESYYGFYATFLGSSTGGNHIDRVADFSNVNHMFWNTEVADIFIANQSKLIIDTSWQFWNGNPGLNPSYQYQWDLIEGSIKSYFSSRGVAVADIKDYIAAFSVEDEPYWRSDFTPSELETAVATIKAGFPDIPVMVIFAYPSVNAFTSSSDIPSNLDWVGFDQYGDFSAIGPLLTIIKAYKQPNQKIWLIPQGYSASGSNSDSTVAGWSYDYHNLFLSDPEIIGQLVYLNRGAREYMDPSAPPMPLTYAVQEDIGSQILTGNCSSDTGYMQTDINTNYYINMYDLAEFAKSWMIDNRP
jgi:hypothetical protein